MKNLYVKFDGIEEMVGTVKEYMYDNEKFYLVSRFGMNEVSYNENEITEVLSNFIVK